MLRPFCINLRRVSRVALLAGGWLALPVLAQPAPPAAASASSPWPAFTLAWARAASCVQFQDARLATLAEELAVRWDDGRWVAGPHPQLQSTQLVEFGPDERVFEIQSEDGSGVGSLLVFKLTAPTQLRLERLSRLRTPERQMCARASVFLTRRQAASAP